MKQTTLDRFGRILLPKPVRRRLGLKPGDTLSLDVKDGTLVARPERPEGAWVIKEGIPVWTGPIPEEMQDIVAYIRRMREERDRHILGLDSEEPT